VQEKSEELTKEEVDAILKRLPNKSPNKTITIAFVDSESHIDRLDNQACRKC